jgi:acyl-CoA synthetase (NDP forming)
MVDICQAGNVRLVGPNCIGVADFSTGAVLSFASIYNDFPPQDGPIAIVSQSGAIGVCAYALLRGAGWGVSCVVTTGNEADVDTADCVAALVAKDGVRIILLYVEEVKNPARMGAALAVARDKGIAVVALNAGGSSDGIRSAGWHTGSRGAATPEVAALLQAQGCRTVQQLGELVASVPLYLGTAWTAPSRKAHSAGLAVISNSGAACVLACDEAQRRRITLAQLGAASRAELDALLPPFSLNRNPVDLTAMLLTDSSLLGRALRCVLDDPAVDAAVLGLLAIGGPSYDTDRFSRDALVAARETAKPLVVFSPHPNVQKIFSEHGHAVYASEAEALGALNGFFAHRAVFNAARSPGSPIANLENHHA